MNRRYDEKGFCIHMYEKNKSGDPQRRPNVPTEFYCELGSRTLCVASESHWFGRGDTINTEILERCPLRTTIGQVLNERSKPNHLRVIE